MSIRMRAACNCCHAAKVRCSGEKTGCARCRALGEECVYAESKMGKTKRRRSTQHSSPASNIMYNGHSTSETMPMLHSHPSMHHLPSTNGFPMPFRSLNDGFFLPPIIPQVTHTLDDIMKFNNQEEMLSPNGDSDKSHEIDCACDLLADVLMQANEDSDGQIQPPHNPFDITPFQQQPVIDQPLFSPTFLAPSPSETYHTPQSSSYTSPGKSSSPPQQSCLAACTSILETLESKLTEEYIPLDEILRINKEALSNLNVLLSRNDFHQSPTCPMLAVTIAQRIATLFETACHDIQHRRWPADSTPSDSSTTLEGSVAGLHVDNAPSTPRIGFGCFSLEPEEQAMLRAQIVCRELRRALVVVRRLEGPAKERREREGKYLRLEEWVGDVVGSLKDLVGVLETLDDELDCDCET